MKTFNECVTEYKKQVKKGDIVQAYKGLLEYMMKLKTYFQKNYPDCFVSGNIYFGYMDMTYFSFIPEALKNKKLKIAIVLIHSDVHFEVWLSGYNKQVQTKYWKIFKENPPRKYRIPATTKGYDSIVEGTLVADPKFDDLDILTKQIEKGTLEFVKDIVAFLR